MSETHDFSIKDLGPRKLQNPIAMSRVSGDKMADYVCDEDLLRYETGPALPEEIGKKTGLLEKAGPREKIFFNPAHVHAGIVSCGGLCPGINDVIRAIVRCLWIRYGVRRITGFQYGYRGFLSDYKLETIALDPEIVDDIHKIGGTMLGSSRGGGDRVVDIVDTIEQLNLNVLFTIGGDGTQKGSLGIEREINTRGLNIAVVGIPKTIDNDFMFLDRSFGFETAVAKAAEAVTSAHTEAHSAPNGIGLVKLMGRESGFISAHTSLASHEVNFCLIPEIRFDIEGPNGLLSHLEKRLARSNHAVIVVAEGAGQELLVANDQLDASGNKKLSDIGLYLRDRIAVYFKQKGIEVNLKYIDPSYMIRSATAIAIDSVYCDRLGNNAVHAAMAGKTGLLIGLVNNEFVHLPISIATSSRHLIDPESALWRDTVEATQQPASMVN